MEDARLDHLTLRLDSLHSRLLNRAAELDASSAMAALDSERDVADVIRDIARSVIAAELREIAGSLE